jgi:hypothetical protein
MLAFVLATLLVPFLRQVATPETPVANAHWRVNGMISESEQHSGLRDLRDRLAGSIWPVASTLL